MKTIEHYLQRLKSDPALPSLIHESGVLKIPFYEKPWGSGRKLSHSKTVKRVDAFWKSVQGTRVKRILEMETDYRCSKMETGSIKDALVLYFAEQFPED